MREAFEIVFVCTGNRFRSPIAAAVFAAETAGRPVRVYSFGFLDVNGAPALPEAVEACASFGIDLSRHRARCLGDRLLKTADLVVGFEPRHVSRAVVDGGATAERAFLLPEVVAALEVSPPVTAEDDVVRARRLVALAGRSRERQRRLAIADPFGGSQEGYERAAAQVRELAMRLAGQLFGSLP